MGNCAVCITRHAMIPIVDKLYDPTRRLFLPKTLSVEGIREIQVVYPIVDNLEKRRNDVFSLSWDSAPINPFQIEKVGICTSRNCPLRCQYCSECSTEGLGGEIANIDILAFVADLMQKRTVRHMLLGTSEPLQIMFSGGGEPTFNFPKFRDLILSIKTTASRNDVPISLSITTNGVFGRDVVNFLCDNFQSIMVSYDGLPEIQNRNRPSPHFKETSPVVIETMQRILDRKVPLIVRTTIWPAEVGLLHKMADYLFTTLGTRFKWSIFPVTPKGRASGKANMKQNEGEDFCDEFLDLVDNAKNKFGTVDISSPLFFSSPVEQYCGSLAYLTKVAWLRHDGRIVTCLEMGKDETVIGKVENGSVEYKESVMDPLTRIAQERQSLCQDCIAFPFCGGGCPADHHANAKNEISERSWACRQTIKFWEHIMQKALAGDECFGWKAVPSRFDDFRKLGVFEFVETKEVNK